MTRAQENSIIQDYMTAEGKLENGEGVRARQTLVDLYFEEE